VTSFSQIINNIQNIYNNKIASYNEFIIINNTKEIFDKLNEYTNYD
jgi:hypothetical protein